MSARRLLTLLCVLGLVVRIAHLHAVLHSTIPRWQEFTDQADFSATWTWATQIRAGNWLGEPTFHPYTRWMQGLGTQADWSRWWGNDRVFQQAPLYPYLVSWLARPPAGSPALLFGLQALLGALCTPLLYLLTLCWGGQRAALYAAGIWSVLKPEVALEAFLGRDAMVPIFLICGLLALENSRREPWTHSWRLGWALTAGLLLGVATLVRENLLLLALAAPFLSTTKANDTRPSHRREGNLRAVMLCIGLGLALTPLVLRNLRVAAAPLALSNRGPEAVLTGLSIAPGASPVEFTVYPTLGSDLDRAHGSTLHALGIALEHARGEKTRFLGMLARKTWAWLGSADPADNVDLGYLEAHSPVLALLLGFTPVLALALLGLFTTVRLHRRFLVLLVALATLAVPLLLTSVLWRIRAGLAPLLVPLAALGLDWVWSQVERKNWKPLAAAVIPCTVYAAMAYLVPVRPPYPLRPLQSWLASQVHLREGKTDEAREDLAEYSEWVRTGRAPFNSQMRRLEDRLTRAEAAP